MVNSSICVCSSSVGNALYPLGLKKHLYFRATPAAIGSQYVREAAQVINGAAGGPPGRGGHQRIFVQGTCGATPR